MKHFYIQSLNGKHSLNPGLPRSLHGKATTQKFIVPEGFTIRPEGAAGAISARKADYAGVFLPEIIEGKMCLVGSRESSVFELTPVE